MASAGGSCQSESGGVSLAAPEGGALGGVLGGSAGRERLVGGCRRWLGGGGGPVGSGELPSVPQWTLKSCPIFLFRERGGHSHCDAPSFRPLVAS